MTKPTAFDFDLEHAEHFVLESEPTVAAVHETLTMPVSRTLRAQIAIKDRARGKLTEFVFYEEGVLDYKETCRGKLVQAYRLMLRYLDPVPTIETFKAKRILHVALAHAGVAALALLLTLIDAIASYALVTAIIAATGALVAAMLAAYLSHQRIVFKTLHGRAAVLRLHAGWGVQRRYHALLPNLGRVIQAAAADIGADTAAFLRQEMREHYRLRADGVLSQDECETSTYRILQQFDGRA